MLLVFVLARKRRLDLATVRAVAERRQRERSGVDERRAAYDCAIDGQWVKLQWGRNGLQRHIAESATTILRLQTFHWLEGL
jgi:hypothetical protein